MHQDIPKPHHAGVDRQHSNMRPDSFSNARGAEGDWRPGGPQRTPEDTRLHEESPKPDQEAQKYSTSESMAAERPPADPTKHRWDIGVGGGEFVEPKVSPDLERKLRDPNDPHGRMGIRNTPSGLSVVPFPPSMHGNKDYIARLPKPAVDPKRFTVEVHGSPDGVEFRGQKLTAKELAELIKASPGYDPGTPVRLLSCKTGADTPDGSPNFAQQLSKELGVEVLAPNKDAWVDNFGNMYASESRATFEKDAAGTRQPKLDEPGQWISFAPDGTKAVHDSPFPPGHEPEWTRFGVDAHNAQQRGIGGPPKEFQDPGGPRQYGPQTRHDQYGTPIPGHISPTGEFVPHVRVDAHGNALPGPNGNFIRAGHVDSEGRWVPERIDQNGNLVPNGHYTSNGQWIAYGRTDDMGRWIPVHFDGQRYHDLGRFNPQTHQWEPLGQVDPNTGQFRPNPVPPPNQFPQTGPTPTANQPSQTGPSQAAAPQPDARRQQFGQQPPPAQQMPQPNGGSQPGQPSFGGPQPGQQSFGGQQRGFPDPGPQNGGFQPGRQQHGGPQTGQSPQYGGTQQRQQSFQGYQQGNTPQRGGFQGEPQYRGPQPRPQVPSRQPNAQHPAANTPRGQQQPLPPNAPGQRPMPPAPPVQGSYPSHPSAPRHNPHDLQPRPTPARPMGQAPDGQRPSAGQQGPSGRPDGGFGPQGSSGRSGGDHGPANPRPEGGSSQANTGGSAKSDFDPLGVGDGRANGGYVPAKDKPSPEELKALVKELEAKYERTAPDPDSDPDGSDAHWDDFYKERRELVSRYPEDPPPLKSDVDASVQPIDAPNKNDPFSSMADSSGMDKEVVERQFKGEHFQSKEIYWRGDRNTLHRGDTRHPDQIWGNKEGFKARFSKLSAQGHFGDGRAESGGLVSTTSSEQYARDRSIGLAKGAGQKFAYVYEIDAAGGIDFNKSGDMGQMQAEFEVGFVGEIDFRYIPSCKVYDVETGEFLGTYYNPYYYKNLQG